MHELSIQVAAALPNSFLVEFIDWTPDDLFVDLPKSENGWFRVPERPGHGLMLTPDALKKYKAGSAAGAFGFYGLNCRQSRSAMTPTARSTTSAASRIMSSRKRRPTIWTPTGWPSFSFAGTMAAGRPMKFMA